MGEIAQEVANIKAGAPRNGDFSGTPTATARDLFEAGKPCQKSHTIGLKKTVEKVNVIAVSLSFSGDTGSNIQLPGFHVV